MSYRGFGQYLLHAFVYFLRLKCRVRPQDLLQVLVYVLREVCVGLSLIPKSIRTQLLSHKICEIIFWKDLFLFEKVEDHLPPIAINLVQLVTSADLDLVITLILGHVHPEVQVELNR